MNNIFTICYSEEEANEIGHFILSRGYEGVQNDSYRYCREAIWWAFKQAKRHHLKLHLRWRCRLPNDCIKIKARS